MWLATAAFYRYVLRFEAQGADIRRIRVASPNLGYDFDDWTWPVSTDTEKMYDIVFGGWMLARTSGSPLRGPAVTDSRDRVGGADTPIEGRTGVRKGYEHRRLQRGKHSNVH